MTTMTSATVKAAGPSHGRGRVIAVTRLIFANKWTVLYLPTIILLSILALNIAIWLLIISFAGADHLSKDAFSYSGAIFYVYIYMMVLAVQAIARTFPFALGYGVTRRAFSLGAALAFVLLSFTFSAIMTALAAIERGTGGWGIGGAMFTPAYYSSANYLEQFGMYFFGLLFFMFLGSAAAAVWVRWKATGLVVFFILLAVIVIGALALLIFLDLGTALFDWLTATGVFGIEAWSLIVTAVVALAGYLILQRATPKG